jgi:hypothetical protein
MGFIGVFAAARGARAPAPDDGGERIDVPGGGGPVKWRRRFRGSRSLLVCGSISSLSVIEKGEIIKEMRRPIRIDIFADAGELQASRMIDICVDPMHVK